MGDYMGGMTGGGAMAGAVLVPWLAKLAGRAGSSVITTGMKRKIEEVLGVGKRPTKYRRKIFSPRVPYYKKGYQRLAGFYGKFKPDFGKELKFLDTVFDIAIRDNWNATANVALVGKGTSPTQRIGRNLTIRSLQMRYTIFKPAALSNSAVRIVIVLDKQTNGEVFNAEKLFVNALTISPNTWRAYRNLENIERFEILWDKIYSINALSSGVSSNETDTVGTYYKKVNIPVEMSGTAPATISDIQTNSVSVWVCGNFTGTTERLKATFRIRFTG